MLYIDQYRACIGIFNQKFKCPNRKTCQRLRNEYRFWCDVFLNFIFINCVAPSLLTRCFDVEPNPGPTGSDLYVYCVNIRSLLSVVSEKPMVRKIDYLNAEISSDKYSIVLVSETWLNQSNLNADMEIQGYTLHRRDRNFNRWGGLVSYIHNSLNCLRRFDLEPPDSEIMCHEIKIMRHKILICSCYRPPNKCSTDFLFDVNTIIDSSQRQYDGILFMGDMNCKHSEFYGNETCAAGRQFKSFFDSISFEQLIHEPTRFAADRESCIDLLFTNVPHLCIDVGTESVLPNCDHAPIIATMKLRHERLASYTREVWNFKNADMEKFRNLLSAAPWVNVMLNDDVNDGVRIWADMFLKIAEECIPHYSVTIRPKDKPWMSSDIRKAIRNRKRLFKEFKRTKENNIKAEYSECRNKIVTLIRNAKLKYENDCEQIMYNQNVGNKFFWKIMKSNIKGQTNSEIPPLHYEGRTVTDAAGKTELLNTYFSSQAKVDDKDIVLPDLPALAHTSIDDLIVEPNDVLKIIQSLNVNKASGHDQIGNLLLKEAGPFISVVLASLFNNSLQSGVFPETWKRARVIPIFKKGNKNDVNNYRPVSLLPCVSKVFEKLIFNHLFDYLREHSIITPKQSGFMPGDSCTNQLLLITHKILLELDKNKSVRAVFLDFTKAFDKVSHRCLLYKMERVGISHKMLKWFSDYFTNRSQSVVLEGKSSSWRHVEAGVPQGSVLGPLCFLLYINDIVEHITCHMYLFADDASIFQTINDNNYKEETRLLNEDLKQITLWAKKWKVEISIPKTFAMLFSRKLNPPDELPLYIGNTKVKNVRCHKHLGLTLSCKMQWTSHIDSVTTAAFRRVNLMKLLKYKWRRKSLLICYQYFIRPSLEYANVVFCNCSLQESNKLESVQYEALRIISGAKRLSSNTALLKDVGIVTLQKRRETHKMILFSKIIHKLSPTYLVSCMPDRLQTRNTRASSSVMFRLPKTNTLAFKNSYFPSCAKLFNSLDSSIRISSYDMQMIYFRNIIKSTHNSFYYLGSRRVQVIIAQLRVGFSNLNSHLYDKGCSNSPYCKCEDHIEDPTHYFFKCKLYAEARAILLNNIQVYFEHNANMSDKLNIILHGSNDLSKESIILAVENFINSTGRFRTTANV